MSMNFFKGGLVKDGSPHYDSVNAKLAKNEFVVRNATVMKGNNLEFLTKFNESGMDIMAFLRNEYLKPITQVKNLLQSFDVMEILRNKYMETEAQLSQLVKNMDLYGIERMNEMIVRHSQINYVNNIDNRQIVDAINQKIGATNKKLDDLADLFADNNFISGKINNGVKQINHNSKNIGLKAKLSVI